MAQTGFFEKIKKQYTPLRKSTNIELLYDLVFIYCLRQITPVVVAAATLNQVTGYTYYTFCFTFVLMMQIWFNSTILMNQYGDGGYADRACLILNMFLLFLMSNAISEDWANYLTYNCCWILILVNYCCHWLYRMKKFTNLSDEDRFHMKVTIAIMAVQAVLVFIANFLPSIPAQVLCACSVLIGFGTWFTNSRTKRSRSNFHHMSERCMLIIIIIFGETIISLGEAVTSESNIRVAMMIFSVFVVLLLIYLQQVDKSLDLETKASSLGYMVITIWLGFTVFNMTLALELIYNDLGFLIDPQIYLGLCFCMYMLSFMLFIPYNKKSTRRNVPGFVARVIACVLMLVAFHIRAQHVYIGILVAFICSVVVLWHDSFIHKDNPSNLEVG